MAVRIPSDGPAIDGVAVTPSDATVIPITRGLYVGTSGHVAVRMSKGNTVTYSNVPVGVWPWAVDMVLSTGTGASNIVALY
jgi:hypothetical protein